MKIKENHPDFPLTKLKVPVASRASRVTSGTASHSIIRQVLRAEAIVVAAAAAVVAVLVGGGSLQTAEELQILVGGDVDGLGGGGQRWAIAILKKDQLPTTLPIASILSSWHCRLK